LPAIKAILGYATQKSQPGFALVAAKGSMAELEKQKRKGSPRNQTTRRKGTTKKNGRPWGSRKPLHLGPNRARAQVHRKEGNSIFTDCSKRKNQAGGAHEENSKVVDSGGGKRAATAVAGE